MVLVNAGEERSSMFEVDGLLIILINISCSSRRSRLHETTTTFSFSLLCVASKPLTETKVVVGKPWRRSRGCSLIGLQLP